MKSIFNAEEFNKLKDKYKGKKLKEYVYQLLIGNIVKNVKNKKTKFFDAEDIRKLAPKFIQKIETENNPWIAFLQVFEDKINIPKNETYKFKKKMSPPYDEFKKLFIQPLRYVNAMLEKRLQGGKKKEEKKEGTVDAKRSGKKCPCGKYVISKSQKKPFSINNLDQVFSILDPEHEEWEHGSENEVTGTFQLIPNFNKEREVIVISGPSGAGKTYLAKQYLRKYKKLNPNNKIILYANKPFDDFDLDYKKGSLEGGEVDKLKVNDFKDSVLVFDDAENITHDKEIQDRLMKFLEELMNVGRTLNITLLIITHVLMNYRFSRNMLMEANRVAMFPTSGMRYQYEQFLKKYVGLNNKQIKDILDTNSRWLVLDKEAPISLLDKNRIKIVR